MVDTQVEVEVKLKPKINLVDDWRQVLSKAWSIRFIVLAALLSGFEVILPLYIDMIPRNLFAALSMIATGAAGVARIIAQPKMDQEAPHNRRANDDQ
jgi:hypothetical protein